MAPQTPIIPPAALDGDGLPSWKPNPFSADPTFDMGFLKAAFDGDLRLVKRGGEGAGRGAEGRRLAEKLGAVRDGICIGLLHMAALGGSLPVCRYLVEDIRLDVDDVGPMGETPLTCAISRQNAYLVCYFLDHGADTEKLNSEGYTPLHFATNQGYVDIVELLLSKGANPDGLSHGGTALHVAANNGHDDIIVKVLLDHHADHKIALSGTDSTALVIATAACSLKCVKLLLEAGADVDGIGKDTPLIIAALAGSTDILKCLVLAGADANDIDSYGHTPIEIAARSGMREHVKILFPVTSRIPKVRDWSVDGIIGNVKSVPSSKKTMLASAKSKAHEAFKNGKHLIAARIYGEVHSCILLVLVYGLIDCLGQVERL
ncbi:hypothetical protein CFC21_052506 [Triticum aestivum]|uniref:Uncharacterized protein n=2 Tax=Triticum aestivum TaxID=4565 RepID=A0A9R1G985_WHEAT|nr:hypothetical protein CFC21_052506 [Triticum aestivum]